VTENKRSRPAVQQTLSQRALCCLLACHAQCLALIAAPVATATASAAPSVPRGGDLWPLFGGSNRPSWDRFRRSAMTSSACRWRSPGDTALVGAPYRTVGGQTNAGSPTSLVRSGTSWSQQAELSDPDPATG